MPGGRRKGGQVYDRVVRGTLGSFSPDVASGRGDHALDLRVGFPYVFDICRAVWVRRKVYLEVAIIQPRPSGSIWRSRTLA